MIKNKVIHNLIDKTHAFRRFNFLARVGIIAFSILIAGYAERSAASSEAETVIQRIAPVGAVYVVPSPEENDKEANDTSSTGESSAQKSTSTDGEAS